MNRQKYVILGTLILLCTSTAHSQSRSPAEILKKTETQGGLIVHVGCGDGRLTAGLRVNDRYVVQGLDTDPANVRKAREHIRSLGIYGQVTVEAFDGKHLPYAENLINLLIVEDSADLTADEIRRVVAPRGVVVIKKNGRWMPWNYRDMLQPSSVPLGEPVLRIAATAAR